MASAAIGSLFGEAYGWLAAGVAIAAIGVLASLARKP